MTLETVNFALVLGLTAAAGASLGWFVTRRRWERTYGTLRRVYLATVATADECLHEQDERLEMLERECARLRREIRPARSRSPTPAAT